MILISFVRDVEQSEGGQLDFNGALVFLDFFLIDRARKEGAMEEVQIKVFDSGIQAGLGFFWSSSVKWRRVH